MSPGYRTYRGEIPDEVERQLAALYQNPFCSLNYFRLQRPQRELNAVALHDEPAAPTQILCYTQSAGSASVLNEYFRIEPEELVRFASLIFEEHPRVNEIHLNRVGCESSALPRPCRVWSASNDVVIDLPASLEEYDERLGKNTKKNVKYYLNRIRREHADFSFQVSRGEEIDPSLVSRIIALNRERMQGKRIRSGYDEVLEEQIKKLCKSFGLVTSISVGNEVIAGVICYDTGSHCFGEAIAHDPRFNKSRIGQVCFYLTLQHLIGCGKSCYHMLEGENDYKYRFLGENRPIRSLTLYRSRRHKLLRLPQLLRFQASFLVKKLHYWSVKYLINKFPYHHRAGK